MKYTNSPMRAQAGFTLVELLLAMAFFGSVLLLATMLLMQILNIYNKGMVVKQMNQVGRTLMEDMAQVSNSGKKIMTGMAGSQVSCVTIDDVTYVWNRTNTSGYAEDESRQYKNSSNQPINFVKITNPTVDCSKVTPGVTPTVDSPIDIASPVIGGTVRVYSMTVERLSGTNLVRIAMTLGTFDVPNSEYNLYENGANGNNLECRPSGLGNFCAKANFETVLYVPNGELN